MVTSASRFFFTLDSEFVWFLLQEKAEISRVAFISLELPVLEKIVSG